MLPKQKLLSIAQRFRGLLPVVVDVETSGLTPATDALLEIAAIPLIMDASGKLVPFETLSYHVEPFIGANMDPEALEVTGIDPGSPLRMAIPEQHALFHMFCRINELLIQNQCQRAVLVGHNAWFDLAFLMAASKRCHLTNNPFHSFTSFDTATIAAVKLGETVLAKALRAVKIPFDIHEAHSAVYDAEKTAELFCRLVNA